MTSDKPFFFAESIQTHGSTARQITVSQTDSDVMALIPTCCWISLQPLSHCVCHWASQWTDTRAVIYCWASYNFPLSSLVDFSQWRSRAENVFTLNLNIQSPLFLSTWSRARDLRNSFGLVCKVVQTARNQISSVTGPTMAKPFDVSQPRGYTIAISFYP